MANTVTLTGTGGLDCRDFQKFAKALRKQAPMIGKEVKIGLRGAGEEVATIARANVAPYSKKIPASVKVRVSSFTVSVVAGGKKAPNAEPFEHGGAPGKFRDPLFGDRSHWYDHQAHPFLLPALAVGREAAQQAIIDVMDKAVGEVVVDTES